MDLMRKVHILWVALAIAMLAPMALGAAPIHNAVISQNVGQLTALFREGVDPNVVDSDGFTALHWAIRLKSRRMINILLDNGADISQRTTDSSRNTPLHLAVATNDESIVRLLLNNGAVADIDAKNTAGNTPLHIAARFGQIPVITLLIRNGASSTITNDRGRNTAEMTTPGSSASAVLEDEVSGAGVAAVLYVPLLFSYGVDLEIEDNQPVFNSILPDLRLGAGAGLIFPLERQPIAPGFEIITRFGLVAVAPFIFEAHLRALTRFELISDEWAVDVTPHVGFFS